MNAIRVQQLCRGLADLRSGTLWPKCHSLNCFQLCGECMLETGKSLDPDLSTNWDIDSQYTISIMEAISREFNIQRDRALCCTAFMMLQQLSTSFFINSSLITVMFHWLFQVQPMRSMTKFCLLELFGRLSLIPLVSFSRTGVNAAKIQINHREMTLLWF